MATDKKISELPVISAVAATDISVLVHNGADYQFDFTTLLQFINSGINPGASISFGTTLPQNTIGKNGDIFINTTAGSFAQKQSGAWLVKYTLPINNGTDGTVLYGSGIPGAGVGNNNDTYINIDTGIFHHKAAGTWTQVFSMQTGPQGPKGDKGDTGVTGANGKTILSGTSNPSNSTTGTNGDLYLNTNTYQLFGPKTVGVWGSGTSIMGLTGEQGDPGPTGTPGAGVVTGGTTGQVLSKVSDADFDTEWVNQSSGGGGSTKPFNSDIVFDVSNQFMKTDQTSDIHFTLQPTGNNKNSYAQIVINPDGVHAQTISDDFFVLGVLDKTQFNILNFCYSVDGIKPTCSIVNVPRYLVLGTPTDLDGVAEGTGATLFWNGVAPSSRFALEKATDDGFSNATIVYFGAGETISIAGLIADTPYYFRVKASAYGYKDSVYSETKSLTTGASGGSSVAYNIISADQNVTFDNNWGFNFNNGDGTDKPFTIGFRVNVATGNNMLISKGNRSGRAMTLGANSGGVNYALLSNDGNYLYKTTSNKITFGIWQHLTFRYDGSRNTPGMDIFINGIKVISYDVTLNSGYTSFADTGDLNIGGDIFQNSQGVFKVDNLFVANRALTDAEVTEAYNSNENIELETATFYDDLIGYWKFNNDLSDSSVNGLHQGTAISQNYTTDI
jgi:hypothetical protein